MNTESKPREAAVPVYLSDAERQSIRVAAAHEGTTMSDFIRRVVLDRVGDILNDRSTPAVPVADLAKVA